MLIENLFRMLAKCIKEGHGMIVDLSISNLKTREIQAFGGKRLAIVSQEFLDAAGAGFMQAGMNDDRFHGWILVLFAC